MIGIKFAKWEERRCGTHVDGKRSRTITLWNEAYSTKFTDFKSEKSKYILSRHC